MKFKIYQEPKRKRFFLRFKITSWLIIANIIFFIAINLLGFFFDIQDIFSLFALQPNSLFVDSYWWTLLTSMFMHVNFFHLFVNMFSLLFVGKFLEMLIGRRRFFWLYILSGIFAGLFYASLSWFFGNGIGASIFGGPEGFAVGASGAIFAVAGVLALLTPQNRVYLIIGPLIALILQSVVNLFIKSSLLLNLLDLLVMLYILISIFALISFSPTLQKIALPLEMPFWLLPIVAIVPLVIISPFVELPIGNMAHLGGFIAGAFYGVYLRIRYKRKTRIISEYFSR